MNTSAIITHTFLANVYVMNVSFMLLSHSGEYGGEYENLKFAPNSPKMIRLAWRNTDKSVAL